jgi:hypothetical protein
VDLANYFAAGDQCVGDLRDMSALKAGDREFIFARLAWAVDSGQSRGAIGSAAGDFSHIQQPLLVVSLGVV